MWIQWLLSMCLFFCCWWKQMLPIQTSVLRASSWIILLINQTIFVIVNQLYNNTVHRAHCVRSAWVSGFHHGAHQWIVTRTRSFCALIWNINERKFAIHCLKIWFFFFSSFPSSLLLLHSLVISDTHSKHGIVYSEHFVCTIFACNW